jgi:hypothetical protein
MEVAVKMTNDAMTEFDPSLEGVNFVQHVFIDILDLFCIETGLTHSNMTDESSQGQ